MGVPMEQVKWGFSKICILYDLMHKKIFIYNRADKWYNKFVTAPILVTGRGDMMEIFTSLYLSIVASVIAYYICKWLDGEDKQ